MTDASPTWPFDASALLLDMDGTLVDSGPSVVRSWNTLFAELGSDETFTPEVHGVPARRVLERAIPGLDGDELDRAFRRIEQLEIEDAGSVVILPGTRRLLDALDAISEEHGRPVWTIVTSCTRPLFEARWEATGLPHPDHLVTADQVESGKPDPDPYLLAMRRLGAQPDRSLVVEDSRGGLESARAAGARSIGLPTTTDAARLAPLADAVVGSLDGIRVEASADGVLVDIDPV